MNPEILEFIKTQRVGVFAIEMLDGSPHAATVHLAHVENPLAFIFETSRRYRKAEPLLEKDVNRASIAIGFEEGKNSKTFQADGGARLIKDSEKKFLELYLNKFPEKQAKAADPDNVFFIFMPTWWRFTDWSKPEGKTIYTSDGKMSVAGKFINV